MLGVVAAAARLLAVLPAAASPLFPEVVLTVTAHPADCCSSCTVDVAARVQLPTRGPPLPGSVWVSVEADSAVWDFDIPPTPIGRTRQGGFFGSVPLEVVDDHGSAVATAAEAAAAAAVGRASLPLPPNQYFRVHAWYEGGHAMAVGKTPPACDAAGSAGTAGTAGAQRRERHLRRQAQVRSTVHNCACMC
jgi:hypothetical protein